MTEDCIGDENLEISPNEKMKVKYYILEEEKIYTELNLETKTYGIKIESYKENIEDIYEQNLVKDITIDRKQAVRLVHSLKKNQVLPEHLKDIVEDLI